jgi:hypothetical protein
MGYKFTLTKYDIIHIKVVGLAEGAIVRQALEFILDTLYHFFLWPLYD